MACGCKKKKIQTVEQPKTAKIVIVEGEVKAVPEPIRPPDVLKSPTPKNVEEIVDRLNNILKPQN